MIVMEVIGVLSVLGVFICMAMLIVAAVRRRPKKTYGIALAICCIVFVIAYMATPVNTNQAELDSLKQRYEESQNEISDLKTESDRLIKENEALNDQKTALETQLEETKLKLETAQTDLEKLSAQAGGSTATGNVSGSSGSGGSANMVYIPKTGSKYHSKSTCSNMKNPSQVTESQAIDLGYGKCSKCW